MSYFEIVVHLSQYDPGRDSINRHSPHCEHHAPTIHSLFSPSAKHMLPLEVNRRNLFKNVIVLVIRSRHERLKKTSFLIGKKSRSCSRLASNDVVVVRTCACAPPFTRSCRFRSTFFKLFAFQCDSRCNAGVRSARTCYRKSSTFLPFDLQRFTTVCESDFPFECLTLTRV